jgi:hypothetical protein
MFLISFASGSVLNWWLLGHFSTKPKPLFRSFSVFESGSYVNNDIYTTGNTVQILLSHPARLNLPFDFLESFGTHVRCSFLMAFQGP